jgi:hypothetical protein
LYLGLLVADLAGLLWVVAAPTEWVEATDYARLLIAAVLVGVLDVLLLIPAGAWLACDLLTTNWRTLMALFVWALLFFLVAISLIIIIISTCKAR